MFGFFFYTWTFSAIKYVCIRMYMCTVKFNCNTLLLKENFSKLHSELVSSACHWVFKGVIFVNITQHLTDHIRTTYRYFRRGVASRLTTAIYVAMVTPILDDNSYSLNDSNLKYESYWSYGWFLKNHQTLTVKYWVLWWVATFCHTP